MTDRQSLLEAFAHAWSTKNLDALMELMAPECEFRSSVGPEPGARFIGRDEVRRGFELFLGRPGGPAPETESTGDLIGVDFAVTRWTSRSTQPDGSVITVCGCDVFEFESDLIKVKDTYRKVTGQLPTGG